MWDEESFYFSLEVKYESAIKDHGECQYDTVTFPKSFEYSYFANHGLSSKISIKNDHVESLKCEYVVVSFLESCDYGSFRQRVAKCSKSYV